MGFSNFPFHMVVDDGQGLTSANVPQTFLRMSSGTSTDKFKGTELVLFLRYHPFSIAISAIKLPIRRYYFAPNLNELVKLVVSNFKLHNLLLFFRWFFLPIFSALLRLSRTSRILFQGFL